MTEQYPNYEPSWPLQVFGQLYHDQGMKKWGGFYLSDHTAARQREAKTAAASELIQSLQNNLKEKDNGSNIKSTTTIRIGYQFNVLLNADLKIRPYESL